MVEVVVVADDLVEEVSIASASQLQLKRRKKSRVATMIPTHHRLYKMIVITFPYYSLDSICTRLLPSLIGAVVVAGPVSW